MYFTKEELKTIDERREAIAKWIKENICREFPACLDYAYVLLPTEDHTTAYELEVSDSWIHFKENGYRKFNGYDFESKAADIGLVISVINNWQSIKISLLGQLRHKQSLKAKALGKDFEV